MGVNGQDADRKMSPFNETGAGKQVFRATRDKARRSWWAFPLLGLAVGLYVHVAGAPGVVPIIIGGSLAFLGPVYIVWESWAFDSPKAVRSVELSDNGFVVTHADGASYSARWEDVTSYDHIAHRGYCEWSFLVEEKRIRLDWRGFSDTEWGEVNYIVRKALLKARVPRVRRDVVWVAWLAVLSLVGTMLFSIGWVLAGQDLFHAMGFTAAGAAFALVWALKSMRQKKSRVVALVSIVLLTMSIVYFVMMP